MEIVVIFLLAIGGYFLGSFPSAYIVARWLKGIDLRPTGDGRLGTSFTYKQVGFWAAALVLFADVSKGAIAVVAAREFSHTDAAMISTGLATILGHDWSIFMGLKGGKGAATTYGVLAAAMLPELLLALALGLIPYLLMRRSRPGLITIGIFGMVTLLSWRFGRSGLLITTPLILAIPMLLKHLTMPRYAANDVAVKDQKTP
jgi:glycerol-3-phosphate acyltransferase PlsY